MRTGELLLILTRCSIIAAVPLPAQDWPMWGGTPQRNMTSAMKGLPSSWDIKTKKNIK